MTAKRDREVIAASLAISTIHTLVHHLSDTDLFRLREIAQTELQRRGSLPREA